MSIPIKDKYRFSCLLALQSSFASTSMVRGRVEYRISVVVSQAHILKNLKQLEKDGYVKRKEHKGFSNGYYWEITESGTEYLSELKEKESES